MRIQSVFRNALALCQAAHLSNLKAFDKKVVDIPCITLDYITLHDVTIGYSTIHYMYHYISHYIPLTITMTITITNTIPMSITIAITLHCITLH